MKFVIKAIPNIITILNLTAGVLGILFWQQDILFASACVFAAMIFDFSDGFIARSFKVSSDFGKHLDSLADVVSFGVLPSCILFGVLHPDFHWITINEVPNISYLLIAIPLCSALRLAKFNIDESQSYEFKGLPTPANACWIAAVPFILLTTPESSIAYSLFSGNISLILMALAGSSFLLIPLPLMSLKFKNFQWKENMFRYIFIGLSILFFIVFSWTGFPIIILFYVIISVLSKLIAKQPFQK